MPTPSRTGACLRLRWAARPGSARWQDVQFSSPSRSRPASAGVGLRVVGEPLEAGDDRVRRPSAAWAGDRQRDGQQEPDGPEAGRRPSRVRHRYDLPGEVSWSDVDPFNDREGRQSGGHLSVGFGGGRVVFHPTIPETAAEAILRGPTSWPCSPVAPPTRPRPPTRPLRRPDWRWPGTVDEVRGHQPGQGATHVSAAPTPRTEGQACPQLDNPGGVVRLVPGERQDELRAPRLQGRRGRPDPAVVDDRPAEREQLAERGEAQ